MARWQTCPSRPCMLRIWLPGDLAMDLRAQMRLKRRAAGGKESLRDGCCPGDGEAVLAPIRCLEPCAALACCGNIQDYLERWLLSGG